MRRGFRRVAVPQAARSASKSITFAAPIRGWIANDNIAAPQPGGAKILENWFPTQTGIRIRGGTRLFATIGTGPVKSMFTYVSGVNKKLFASSASAVFNITSVADPTVAPAAEFSGLGSGYFSFAQFATVGGDYLYITNGTDSPRLYDGTTWTAITGASVPAITGVTTSLLSHVWVYRNRLFFIQGGSMNAWCLPVDSIGGALIQVSLAGIFQNGGALLTGGTWSLDSGAGIDDRCVFISTTGEVAVFEGADPSDPLDWALAGKYNVTPVLGKRALINIGGDLLLMTQDGIVPISQVIDKDPAALSLAAVTRNIGPEWKNEVISRDGLNWEMIKFTSHNMGIVSLPNSATTSPYCFVVNLETGAWCKYTGLDTNCLIMHADWAYFASSTGKVFKMEIGGSDNGSIYIAKYVGLFDHFKTIGFVKTVLMGRATFIASKAFIAQLSVSTDYTVSLPSPPNSVADSAESLWDVGLWDVALWDASAATQFMTTQWVSIGLTGFVIAAQIQVTCGVTPTPDAELAQIDFVYEPGELTV